MNTVTETDIYKLIKLCSNNINVDDYRNSVWLVVNVTMHDSRTKIIFQMLDTLNKKYKQKGLRILCFPCFQFGISGSRDEIVNYVTETGIDVGVIFDEVEVNGPTTNDLYKYLKMKRTGMRGQFVPDNFTYFLIDRKGKVCDRLSSKTDLNTLDYMIYQLL